MRVRCRPGRQVPELPLTIAIAISVGLSWWWAYGMVLRQQPTALQPVGWRQQFGAAGFSLMVLLLAMGLMALACTAVVYLGELLIGWWRRMAEERSVRKRRWKNLG